MIRPAKSIDAFALCDLLTDVHSRTVYNGLEMDPKAARKLFAQLAQRHGGSHDGATFLTVLDRKGVICGFVAGMLDRVYHVGEDLWATDVFICTAEGEPVSTMKRLIDAYVEWAESNSNVYEVRLSTSYAAPTGRRMEAYFERMGFEECGKVYRRANPNYAQSVKQELAA